MSERAQEKSREELDEREFPQANVSNPSVVKILFAAGQCFAEHGYEKTTTKEIAQRAGVSKSLLHYHFESKEHLLYELQDLLFNLTKERIRNYSLKGEPSIERAIATLDMVWRLICKNDNFIFFGLDLWNLAGKYPALQEHHRKFMRSIVAFVEEAARDALGPVADQLAIPVSRLAQLLVATIPGFAMRLQVDAEGAQQAFDDFKDLLTKLITVPSA
ncbi:MAG: TetR/AcrR family transcriptional regulator [Chrysiogenetes bacterium]|nr:TetR/AcrR family transcriptional regulator [Chrysiogenetes bacterium]